MVVSRAAAAAQKIPDYAKTAGRAVYVKVHPQPSNLAESREVLRVLQRYGELVMYKHLKHEPNLYAANTALAVYQNANAAQDVINASPFSFVIEDKKSSSSASDAYGSINTLNRDKDHENSQVSDMVSNPNTSDKQEWPQPLAKGRRVMQEPSPGGSSFKTLQGGADMRFPHQTQTTSIPTTTPRTPRPFTSNPTPFTTSSASLPFPPSPSSTSASPPSEAENDRKEFHLTATRSVLNHHAYIQRQHYYGGFKLDKMNTMVEDLERRVPLRGMADTQLSKGETPLRMRVRRQEEERAKGGRQSLRELWEEGRRERGQSNSNDST